MKNNTDKIHYKFRCGIKAYQSQMTVDENGRMADALAKLNVPATVGEMTFKQLMDTTLRKEPQKEIVEMVLVPCYRIPLVPKALSPFKRGIGITIKRNLPRGWTGKLLLSEFDGVEQDFFGLNPRWNLMLAGLKLNWGGTTSTLTSSDGGTKSTKKAPHGSAAQAIN
jgi:hypothetical protein